MEKTVTMTKKEFLHMDETVKFSFGLDGEDITINCDHPIFENRFHSNSATLDKNSLFSNIPKGSGDYDFFENMMISVQEYYLDHGAN